MVLCRLCKTCSVPISWFFYAFSLSLCLYCGALRRARPGKVVSMYMTRRAASQKSKLSIAEARAVGTESEPPALEHGRIVSCHSPVAQIKKRGATVRLHVPAFFRLMQASRLDPGHWPALMTGLIRENSARGCSGGGICARLHPRPPIASIRLCADRVRSPARAEHTGLLPPPPPSPSPYPLRLPLPVDWWCARTVRC